MASIIGVNEIQHTNGTTAATVDTSGNLTASGDLTITGHCDPSKMAGSSVSMNTKSSHTFSNIPSVYNRLTLIFNGLSVGTTGETKIQFGTSGGIVTTGYWNRDGYASDQSNYTTALDTNNDCFTTANWTGNTNGFYGYWEFHHAGGNTWFSRINGAFRSNNNNYLIEQFGQIDLSDTLTQIKISAASGTFDAGTINLLYG